MAGHELIDAHLDALSARLPAQAVEELADGLAEAYEVRLQGSDAPEEAARAAIAEFGDVETVTAAFFRESPWRRTALVLLATGPLMAAAWASALLTAHAWFWPIPMQARLLYGAGLAAIVAVLVMVVREKRAYRRTRLAVLAGAVGLIILDGVALAVLMMMGPAPSWPIATASTASLIRVLAMLRGLPAVLTG
jgi:hypothetical protein